RTYTTLVRNLIVSYFTSICSDMSPFPTLLYKRLRNHRGHSHITKAIVDIKIVLIEKILCNRILPNGLNCLLKTIRFIRFNYVEISCQEYIRSEMSHISRKSTLKVGVPN